MAPTWIIDDHFVTRDTIRTWLHEGRINQTIAHAIMNMAIATSLVVGGGEFGVFDVRRLT